MLCRTVVCISSESLFVGDIGKHILHMMLQHSAQSSLYTRKFLPPFYFLPHALISPGQQQGNPMRG